MNFSFFNLSEDFLLTVEAVDRVLFELSVDSLGYLVDFDDDLADILPPFAQNSIINWFENFEIGNLEKKSQNVTFETFQGDLIHGILTVFAINSCKTEKIRLTCYLNKG